MKQFLLPLSDEYHCQECLAPVSAELAVKSKQRCQGNILCFKHQMFFTSQHLKAQRLAKRKTKTRRSTPVAAQNKLPAPH